MLTKVTAHHLGVSDRENPEQAIPASARYIAELSSRLSDVPEPERKSTRLNSSHVALSRMPSSA